MTRIARDNRDGPFSDWVRTHPELEQNLFHLGLTDIDFTFQKYRAEVDRQGSREIKLMLDVEVKKYGSTLTAFQCDALYIRHQLLEKKIKLYSTYESRKIMVWYFGQFVLRIHGGNRPNKCKFMEWGVFGEKGKIKYSQINEQTLIKILRFDARPDNFKVMNLTRHHQTSTIINIEKSRLGFDIPESITTRY
uniref:Uncharacterized protein n=1 Tax=viral metagenome TaxID=1070528 RepID=A0A6M3J8E9_9ZZZZ